MAIWPVAPAVLSAIISGGQAKEDATIAYTAPAKAYLNCIAPHIKTGRVAVPKTTAAGLVAACEPLFPAAIAGFTALAEANDGMIDYRARYLRSHGRDPDLAALLAPGLRGDALILAQRGLDGATGGITAQVKLRLHNPDRVEAPPVSPARADGRLAAPASGTR